MTNIATVLSSDQGTLKDIATFNNLHFQLPLHRLWFKQLLEHHFTPWVPYFNVSSYNPSWHQFLDSSGIAGFWFCRGIQTNWNLKKSTSSSDDGIHWYGTLNLFARNPALLYMSNTKYVSLPYRRNLIASRMVIRKLTSVQIMQLSQM